jgi:hypothetical protein
VTTGLETESTMDTRNLLGVGIYSVPEAARLTGVTSDAIRRWLWAIATALTGRLAPKRRRCGILRFLSSIT